MAAFSYNQNFDALSIGNLNGQDSWTGIVNPNNCTVQNSVFYTTSQAVYNNGSLPSITRVVSTATSGTVYWAMRCKTSSASGDGTYVVLYSTSSGTSYTTIVKFVVVGGTLKIQYYSNGAYVDFVNPASLNTWYVIGINYNGAANTFQINLNNGSFSGNLATGTAGNAQIEKIQIGQDAVWEGYIDSISTTYPTQIQNLTLTAATGAFTLTGYAATLLKGHAYAMVAAAGLFVLTGLAAVLKYKPLSKWVAQNKTNSTWTAQSKSSSTWTAEQKS